MSDQPNLTEFQKGVEDIARQVIESGIYNAETNTISLGDYSVAVQYNAPRLIHKYSWQTVEDADYLGYLGYDNSSKYNFRLGYEWAMAEQKNLQDSLYN